MDDDGIAREFEALRRGFSVENIFYVIDGQTGFVLAALGELPEFLCKLLDAGFLALQNDFIAPRHDAQFGEIGAEFRENLVSGPVNFDGVDVFQLNCFLHLGYRLFF